MSVEPRRREFNHQTTHVEALVKSPQDGGSIPPASILKRLLSKLESSLFSLAAQHFASRIFAIAGSILLAPDRSCQGGYSLDFGEEQGLTLSAMAVFMARL